MKTKKVNKFKKASSKLAFLFACAIVVSPGITSLQSCATTSEDIPCEIISSSRISETHATRSNKTMKQANRKNDDVISYDLNYYNSSLNIINLHYLVCNANVVDDSDTYYLYCSLDITYDLNTNLFVSGEFELEYSEDRGPDYFLDYVELNETTINFLNNYTGNNNAYIYTLATNDFNGVSIMVNIVDDYDYYLLEDSFYLSFTPFNSFERFGEDFSVGNIIDEVDFMKQLINAKYNDGIIVGEEIGYNDGYDNGYDAGYEQARLDNAIATIGPLANLPLEYGFYNVNTDEYDYSNQVDINLYYTDYLELLNGGFKITDWDDYETMWTEDEVEHSDYLFSFTIPFGQNGVRIDNINKLFPINGFNVPRLDYGQELIIKTTTHIFVWNGADDYALQYIDFETFQNGILKNSLITSIQMTGINADYIPYGLMTNNDYSLGYEKGFDSGFTSGVLEGRNEGYENGFNDGKIASGTSYADGYNKGYQDAKNQYQNAEALSFEDVLTAVITAPNKIIREGFDFDILGINVGSFIQTCVVIGLIVFTIGLFKKG